MGVPTVQEGGQEVREAVPLYLLEVGNGILLMLTEQLCISKPVLLQEILCASQLQLLKVFPLHFSSIILNNTSAVLAELILYIT